ncbi:MAG TPA: HEAT repeat domain-containing protein [Thermoanaerobaculia bacterium]|nr:HEAT repeat domain-containing protein [Thermoanaerobaculia bacterium]
MTRIKLAALLFIALPAFGNIVIDLSSESKKAPRESRESRNEREESLYDRATEALDDHDWQRAASLFRSVANLHLEHGDAALYWLAYANNKRGLRGEALAAVDELKRTFPKSRWIEDSRALEVEIRQSSGQHIEIHRLADADEKLTVLSGLMESDPDQGVRLGAEILKSTPLVKVKDGVLFVFTQSGDPRAISIVTETAKDNTRPDLQVRAVRYLAISGGEETKKALTEVYLKAKDKAVRKAVMKAYLITGDRVQLLNLAKNEPNSDLRSDAVTELGAMGARNELADLYKHEAETPIRKRIIQAMFIGGSSDQVLEIAKTEKNPELRVTAIRNLGFMGGRGSAPTVASLYDSETDTSVKRAIISSLFFMDATAQLRDLAQKEKDEDLREEINDKLERLRE